MLRTLSMVIGIIALSMPSAGASSFISKELKKRYQQDEVLYVAFAEILGQQCGLKMSPGGLAKYNRIIMKSITYGEEELNIAEKLYYRARAADHNPLFYEVLKIGRGTTYRRRPGDGFHLLVNEFVKGIYKLPCEKIIKRSKRTNIYNRLYQ